MRPVSCVWLCGCAALRLCGSVWLCVALCGSVRLCGSAPLCARTDSQPHRRQSQRQRRRPTPQPDPHSRRATHSERRRRVGRATRAAPQPHTQRAAGNQVWPSGCWPLAAPRGHMASGAQSPCSSRTLTQIWARLALLRVAGERRLRKRVSPAPASACRRWAPASARRPASSSPALHMRWSARLSPPPAQTTTTASLATSSPSADSSRPVHTFWQGQRRPQPRSSASVTVRIRVFVLVAAFVESASLPKGMQFLGRARR